jgi:hypothetical protein
MATTPTFDTPALKQRVKERYREVAEDPPRPSSRRRRVWVPRPAWRTSSSARATQADVTSAQLPVGVTCDASLRAACIGGAMQRADYGETIERAGFRIEDVRENDEYRFVSERADTPTRKHGVKSISILAVRSAA